MTAIGMKECWNRLRALIGGYFWKRCRLCGAMFGGHQWEECGTITIKYIISENGMMMRNELVCPTCRRLGRDIVYNEEHNLPYKTNGTIHMPCGRATR